MTRPSDQELLELWRDQPAPLLPLLHAFHDRDGHLSEEAIRGVAKGLRIPVADLYGSVTFYHHFARTPGGKAAPRVCDGPVCKLKNCDGLLAELREQGATTMPCAGRCDDPIPVIKGDGVLVGLSASELVDRPSLLPPPNPGGAEECVFAHIRDPQRATLAGYRQGRGYEGLARAIREMTPDQVLATVDRSGLTGRGGAGFPTGRKWRAVADAPGSPKTIVCNADEGEPGCFKDRVLMTYDPHALIEGMILAAFAAGAERGFIYLRYEYPEIESILSRAIEDAKRQGLLGTGILGSALSFESGSFGSSGSSDSQPRALRARTARRRAALRSRRRP